MSADLYSILDVSKTASLEDIKKAYKKLAIKYHPDKCRNDNEKKDNEDKFKEINKAYSILSNPEKREKYDKFGTLDDTMNMGSGMNMDDILKDIFGGGFSSGGQNSSFSFMFMDGMGNVQQGGSGFGGAFPMFHNVQKQMKKMDTIEVQIDINDIYYGQTKKVEFEMLDKCESCNGTGAQDPSHILKCITCQGNGIIQQQVGPFFTQSTICPSCAGEGTTVQHNKHCTKCKGKKTFYNKKVFELKLPKGIPNQYEVVMEGKGAYNQQAKTNNDIRFRFIYNIKEPYQLEENKTVHYHLSITLEELLGGFTKTIEVYKEKIVLSSDHYFNPLKTLVLHDMGVYDMKGEKQRDLHIHFNILYSDNERYKKYADVMKKVLKVSKDKKEEEDINTEKKSKNTININDFL
jgi:DnaJ-class molecular chaperone